MIDNGVYHIGRGPVSASHERRSYSYQNKPQKSPFQNTTLILLILQLIIKLLTQLQKEPIVEPEPELDLTEKQRHSIQTKFGIFGEQNFVVIDKDGNGKLSAGDVVSVSGGFTGGHIFDFTLSQADVDELTGKHLVKAMDDYIVNRAKWDANHPDKYEFTYQRSGFLPPEYRQPIRHTVENGNVIKSEYLGVSSIDVPEYDKKSIDGLFSLISKALEEGSAEVRVKYNSETGIPESIFIDRDQMIADEEVFINTKDFKVLDGALSLTDLQKDAIKSRFDRTEPPVGRTDYPQIAFTGDVIDTDSSGTLSVGDIVKLRVSGGNQSPFVQNDVYERVLSAEDIEYIGKFNLI